MVDAAVATGANEESQRADGGTKHLPGCAQSHRRRGTIKVRTLHSHSLAIVVNDLLPCVVFVSAHLDIQQISIAILGRLVLINAAVGRIGVREKVSLPALREPLSLSLVLPCCACSKCLTVDTSVVEMDGQRRGRGLTLEEERTFKEAFAAVMVDTSLGFNVFGEWEKQETGY